jgi:hypothetical protein
VVAEGYSAGENDLVGVRIAADGSMIDSPPRVLVPAEYYLYFALDLHFAGGEYLLTYDNLSDMRARRFTPDLTPAGTFVLPGLALATNGTSYYVAWGTAGSFVGSPMTMEGVRTFPGGVPIVQASAVNGIAVAGDGARWWFGANEYVAGMTLRRIALDGAVIDATGIAVDPPSVQHVGPFAVEGAPGGGAIAGWQDSRAGGMTPQDVRAGFVSAGGTPAARGPVSLSAPAQVHADLVTGQNGFLVAFQSRVSGATRILVQRLAENGAPLDAEPIQLASGLNLGAPAAAWNGSVYFVTWSDGTTIYGRRVLPDGTLPDPVPTAIMGRFSPDVAAVGDVFLVVGIDYANNNPELQVPVARRVSASGQPIDQQSRVLGFSFVRNTRVIACQGRWLAMWQRHSTHDNPPASLGGAFVEADGTSHPEFGNVTPGFAPDLAFSGGTVLIAYRTGTDATQNKDIRGLRMLPDGSFPGGTGGFVISAPMDEQLNPTATWDGQQFVVVWQTKQNAVRFFDERTDLYGARVTEGGVVLDPSAFVVADDAMPEQLPALASRADGRSILAASLFRQGPPFASYRMGMFVLSDTPITGTADAGGAPVKHVQWTCPNPFAPGMAITYRLAGPERVALRFYSARGTLVATQVEGVQGGGEHRVVWDGRDEQGISAARGVYFVRLEVGSRTEQRRIVLLR